MSYVIRVKPFDWQNQIYWLAAREGPSEELACCLTRGCVSYKVWVLTKGFWGGSRGSHQGSVLDFLVKWRWPRDSDVVKRRGKPSGLGSPVIDELQQREPESVTGDKADVTQEGGCYGILQLLLDLGRNVSCWLHSWLYVPLLLVNSSVPCFFSFWVDFHSLSSGQGLCKIWEQFPGSFIEIFKFSADRCLQVSR